MISTAKVAGGEKSLLILAMTFGATFFAAYLAAIVYDLPTHLGTNVPVGDIHADYLWAGALSAALSLIIFFLPSLPNCHKLQRHENARGLDGKHSPPKSQTPELAGVFSQNGF